MPTPNQHRFNIPGPDFDSLQPKSAALDIRFFGEPTFHGMGEDHAWGASIYCRHCKYDIERDKACMVFDDKKVGYWYLHAECFQKEGNIKLVEHLLC